ncbi:MULTISPECIES: hypothetical protein [unclassified Sulfitobacter]|jgi:hypothetical protein|uniref:hypothetical protein n=1 Tax=unclassified Sulfitobacter TaxID=196795 RepID=UPI0015933240|nr:hypothetical protein [Sulfitobacter sp. HGT1]MBQ0805340.1 hypothetical protein [Sulfitobacter sp.]
MKILKSLKSTSTGLASGVSAFAVAAALTVIVPITFPSETGAFAFAQQSGQGGGNGQGAGGSGSGAGGQGAGGSGSGQGEPDSDSEGKGPKAGSSGGSQGGKPVWAQEGIPEVELGRLNVARSPDRILAKAVEEEISKLTPEAIAFYSMSLDQMITALKTDFDNVTMIDSPVANLGLLKDVMDGTSSLTAEGVVNTADVLAAVFLGSASDKTVEITADTASAVATILGYNLSDAQAESLAADAEAIREAILEGHG